MYILLAVCYCVGVDGGDAVCGDATTFALQGYIGLSVYSVCIMYDMLRYISGIDGGGIKGDE